MKRSQVVLLAVVGVLALVVTWLVEPNLIIGLRSPRALALSAGLGAVCLGVGWLAYRRTGPRTAIALGLLPGIVATALVVVRPHLNTRELNEAFPTAAPTTPAATTPAVTSPSATPSAAALQTPVAAPTTPAAVSTPLITRVATGSLRGLAGHEAKGTVSTYRLADGSHSIRFQDVDIGGTPDPEVWVVPGADKTKTSGGIHLGHLKAEKGSFNYALPAGFATKGFTVLVWCEQFAIEIANATQA